MNTMKYKKSLSILIILFSTFSLTLSFIQGNAELSTNGPNTKFGISWVNTVGAVQELDVLGYQKASEMAVTVEHRDYSWDSAITSEYSIKQWTQIYLRQYPQIEASMTIAPIFIEQVTLRVKDEQFTPYTSQSNLTAVLRFNDTRVVTNLKGTFDILYNVWTKEKIKYISFGNEINAFFRHYYNDSTSSFTDTQMLEDYSDLCIQMYDYIKDNYSSVRVQTIFRYQLPKELEVISALIDYFDDACDLFAISPRIFITNLGEIAQLSYQEIEDRVLAFKSLIGLKKLAVINVFTISEAKANGSGFYQAQLVADLFELARNIGDDLELLTWYRLFDFPPGYVSIIDPGLESLSTAGLLTFNGDAKLSYFAWIDAMKLLGRIPESLPIATLVISIIILCLIGGFILFVVSIELNKVLKKSTEKEDEPQTITLG